MSQSLRQFTAELTKAQIEAGLVFPESINETLRQTFEMLATLKAQEEGRPAILQPAEQEPKDWRKSIT